MWDVELLGGGRSAGVRVWRGARVPAPFLDGFLVAVFIFFLGGMDAFWNTVPAMTVVERQNRGPGGQKMTMGDAWSRGLINPYLVDGRVRERRHSAL